MDQIYFTGEVQASLREVEGDRGAPGDEGEAAAESARGLQEADGAHTRPQATKGVGFCTFTNPTMLLNNSSFKFNDPSTG